LRTLLLPLLLAVVLLLLLLLVPATGSGVAADLACTAGDTAAVRLPVCLSVRAQGHACDNLYLDMNGAHAATHTRADAPVSCIVFFVCMAACHSITPTT
jgi:nitrous oxide reductase accessory protein NosL